MQESRRNLCDNRLTQFEKGFLVVAFYVWRAQRTPLRCITYESRTSVFAAFSESSANYPGEDRNGKNSAASMSAASSLDA